MCKRVAELAAGIGLREAPAGFWAAVRPRPRRSRWATSSGGLARWCTVGGGTAASADGVSRGVRLHVNAARVAHPHAGGRGDGHGRRVPEPAAGP